MKRWFIATLLAVFAQTSPAFTQPIPQAPPTPVLNGSTSLAVSNASANVALPATNPPGLSLTICNVTGGKTAYYLLETGTGTLATTSNTAIQAGMCFPLWVGSNDHLAAITGGSDTTTLYLYQGTGPFQVSQLGGSGGGGGGVNSYNGRTGAVTGQASDVSGVGGLLAANNLSDIGSTSTARTNLGLGTFATQNFATPPAIGGTTPAAGSFNGLTVTGSLTATGLVTNADLANSSITIAGHVVSLGGTQAIACADLSNAGTGCPANTGTNGATLAEWNAAGTISALWTFTNSDFAMLGSSTGATTLTSDNAGASNFTLHLPAANDTLADLAGTQTFTGKTISFASNTLTGVCGPTGSAGILSNNGSSACTTDTNATLSAGALTLGASAVQGSIVLNGATSGTSTIVPTNVASGTFTLPTTSGTLMCLSCAQTLTATLTDAAGDTFSAASGITLGALMHGGGFSITGLGALTANGANSYKMFNQTPTATVPDVTTNQGDANTGLGGVINHIALIAGSVNQLDCISTGCTIPLALTYGGVTLSNAVTGTGNMVLSASPTISGTLTATNITMTGAGNFNTSTASNINICTSTCTGTVTIGNSSNTGKTILAGLATAAADNGTCNSAAGVISTAGAAACTGISTARVKNSIAPLLLGLEAVMASEPVRYYYNKGVSDNGANPHYGFLAEDVQVIAPELTTHDANGAPLSWRWNEWEFVLTNAVKQQEAEIASLQWHTVRQDAAIASLQSQVATLSEERRITQ